MDLQTWKIKLGQRLSVGFDGYTIPEDYRKAVHEMKLGNVILFRSNVHDYDQLRKLCIDLRELFITETGHEPFIMIDEECGTVSRLAPCTIPTPSAMAIGATCMVENAYTTAYDIGEMLHAVGINFNLAPVLDCNTNPHNPVIGVRSFGSDPALVSAFGNAYVDGLHDAHIIACGKHFPGHGDTSVDSHIGLPLVNKTLDELRSTELVSFKAAIAHGIDAIMSAHVLFPALEPDRKPGTVSKRIMTDLLRDELGFTGLIISDGMEMHAVLDLFGIEDATRRALCAGVDIALVCHSSEQACSCMRLLLQTVENGEMDMEAAETAYQRIIAAKKRIVPPDEGDQHARFGNDTQRRHAEDILHQAVQVLHAPDHKPLPDLRHAAFFGAPASSSSNANDTISLNAAHLCAEALGAEWLTALPDKMLSDRPMVLIFSPHHPIHHQMIECAKQFAAQGGQVVAVSMTTPYCLNELPDAVWKIAVYQYDHMGVNALLELIQ